MNSKRIVFVGLVLLSGALAYPYVRALAIEPQVSDIHQSSGPIFFGAPEHVAFFKYQVYSTAHKKYGVTPEEWNALPPQKQQELLSAGETRLNALHKELLAKPQLNAEETEFLQAVWGKDNKPDTAEVTVSEDAAAKAKPVTNEKVEAIFSTVENSKKTDSWNQLFDGGGDRSIGTVPMAAAAPPDSDAVKTNAKSVSGNSKNTTPPALGTVPNPSSNNATNLNNNEGGTGGKTLPVAIGAGAILLAGAWGLRRKFSGNNPCPANPQANSILTSGCKPLNFTSGEVLTLEKAKLQSEFESLPDLKGCRPFGFDCQTKGNDPTCGTKGNGPCKCYMGDYDCPEHCSVNVICSCKGPVGYIPQDQCHPYTDCPGNTNCRPVEG